MGGKTRRRALRRLVACGAVVASLVPAAPAGAIETCQGISRPGVTITVAGQPVRIPAIEVTVCVDTPTPVTLVPQLIVQTQPTVGSPCVSECLAIGLLFNPDQPATTVTVTVRLDGAGPSETITIPHPGTFLCLVSGGEPEPMVPNCLILLDPD
jgi:hypothetical protein